MVSERKSNGRSQNKSIGSTAATPDFFPFSIEDEHHNTVARLSEAVRDALQDQTSPPASTADPSNLTEGEFAHAVAKLDQSLKTAMSNVFTRIAPDARAEIKAAPITNKNVVFRKWMGRFLNGCRDEIIRFSPRYLSLGCKAPQFATPDPSAWAHDCMFHALYRWLGGAIGTAEHGVVAQYVIEICDGDRMHAWCPPDWLSGTGQADEGPSFNPDTPDRYTDVAAKAAGKKRNRDPRPGDAEIEARVKTISDDIASLRDAMRRDEYGNYGSLRSSQGKEHHPIFKLIDGLPVTKQVDTQRRLWDALQSKRVESFAHELVADATGESPAYIGEACYRIKLKSRHSAQSVESSDTSESSTKVK